MPKRFIFVLIVAQTLLTSLHWLLYKLTMAFFPVLMPQHAIIGAILILLSFSFLIFSWASYNHDILLLRWGYTLAAVWLVVGFYFTITSLGALLGFFITPLSLSLLGFFAVALSALLSIYGLLNARVIRIIPVTVSLPNLPAAWQGKTAIMVSDLHLGQILRPDTAKKIVSIINRQKPEIVFIPGDFYDGVHTDFNALAQPFKNINAPFGVYFSSGNHEVYAGYEKCEQSLKGAGIKILEDQKVELAGLQVAGLAYKNETDESVKNALAKLEFDPSKPSILLKHVPSHVQPVADAGVSLQLSGHTHLGQVWPFRYITKKVFKGFDYGFKNLNQLQIYTSSGVGTWGPPLRVFTKAEIIKITFQ